MNNDTDFAVLYHILGLHPGCRLDELRLAYRRQVAALHPDRNHGDGSELQRLNALYEAALDFMRRNGRLPGAPPATPPTTGNPARGAAVAPVGHRHDATPAHNTRLRTIAALLLVLLLAAVAWGTAGNRKRASAPEHEPVMLHMTVPANVPTQLAPEMLPAEVRRLEGDPIQADDALWEYGPSWIAFHCGRVSGWYSSPWRPLHTDIRQMEPGTVQPRCRARHDPGD